MAAAFKQAQCAPSLRESRSPVAVGLCEPINAAAPRAS